MGARQSRDAIKRSSRLLDLWRSYRDRLLSARSSPLALQLVDELFASPVIALAGAGKLLGVTPRAAQGNIDKLIVEGILKETTGQQRNRVYAASRSVEIVEAEKA
jgi:Fic family protein